MIPALVRVTDVPGPPKKCSPSSSSGILEEEGSALYSKTVSSSGSPEGHMQISLPDQQSQTFHMHCQFQLG